MQQFLDSAPMTGVRETTEGYLIADAFTARTGIQTYLGSEVGKPELATVAVYRPEAEVFKNDSVASYSHVPVTNDHPPVAVEAVNWKDFSVGEASTEVMRDGHRLRIPLIVKDAAAIAAIKAGKRQLSVGYACDLVFKDGVTDDGIPYQAVQTNIKANHIAIVQNGRAGVEFRIGDSAVHWGATPIVTDKESPMNTRTIVVDGISIQTTDQGAEAIAKIQKQLSDQASTSATAIAAATQTIATKDSEIGALKVELATAKDAAPTGPKLDKLVADRATLLDTAKKIAKDAKFDGLSDADVRKVAVTAKFGEDMVKDASEDQIAGMFKAASATLGDGNADPVTLALRTGDKSAPKVNDNGQAAYETRLADAWKTPAVTV